MSAILEETKTYTVRVWVPTENTTEDHFCIWRWCWSVTDEDGRLLGGHGADTRWGALWAARRLARNLTRGPYEERWKVTFERVR